MTALFDDNTDTLDASIEVAPSSTHGHAQEQFVSMANAARVALRTRGLEPSDIVRGWVRFATMPHWGWRDELSKALLVTSELPITGLVQPPVVGSQKCVLDLYAARGTSQSRLTQVGSPRASSCVRAGAKHLRIMSIAPKLVPGASFENLAYDMFEQAGLALGAHGLRFSDAVRTWVHVSDIDVNYTAMNRARNRYFREQGLARLPASTCVEGFPVGVGAPLAMDLYAVSTNLDVNWEALRSGTMGEASAYGVAFSRAVRLSEPGVERLFISGTASIDARGQVVSVGNVSGQLDCMFRNVHSLLNGAQMGFADVQSATMYLKHAEYYGEYVKAARAYGLSATLPCAVVVTNICRPEWLCEIELCAARRLG